MFDFRTPLFLILLAAIPVLIFVQRRTHLGTTKWRKSVTFCLRGAALLCAILALANLHRTHKEQRLAVAFLIDTSESIPRGEYEEAFKQINAAVAKLRHSDKFGIISFAKEAPVVAEIRQKQDQLLENTFTELPERLAEQTISRDSTDVLNALKRAIALLPDDYHRRIVLFSDGIHNTGGTPVEDYLPLLSANNVEILTIPLNAVKDAIRVTAFRIPNQVRKGQRFEIAAIIETDGSIPKLNATLYRNNALIDEVEWNLETGRNVLSLPMQQIPEAGNYRYELKLNVTDEIPENNQGYGVVKIQDKPHALYVEGDSAQTTHLKTVLEENGFEIETTGPEEMPTELVELQRSDILILSNVSADVLSPAQLQNIENYVQDLGHGLVVIGGERAYGPGGYTDTALARVLPVKMTPREQKDTVAVFFVLDTSGSMANYVAGHRRKIDLAIAGISAGIDNLEEDDVAGAISFSAGKPVDVVSDLTSDRDMLLQAVGKLKPTGGTTLMKEAIEKAYERLKANDAKRKYIILLSDGKSDEVESDLLALAEQTAKAHISITTIAIGDANRALLRQLSEISGGRPVTVEHLQQLPTLLMEAVQDTQRYIVQEPFQPVITAPSEPIMEGIGRLPQLHGYTATTEKQTAQVFIRSHKDDPLLAGWNFGLGKAIAWTSDVKSAWAQEWIPWQNFGKFWGRVVNWTLPAADANADFDLRGSFQHGIAAVNLDTRSPSQATYEVRVAGPNGTSELIEMQQMTSTRYSGTFQMQDSGSYIITAQGEGDKRTEVLSLPYPIEYTDFRVNTDWLKMLAAGTGGIHDPVPAQIAASAGAPIETQIPLAQALLVAAALLFVLEMILRRYSITNRHIAAFFGRLRGKSLDTQAVGTTAETVPSTERAREDTVPSQSTETSVSRLLAAKRRVR